MAQIGKPLFTTYSVPEVVPQTQPVQKPVSAPVEPNKKPVPA